MQDGRKHRGQMSDVFVSGVQVAEDTEVAALVNLRNEGNNI